MLRDPDLHSAVSGASKAVPDAFHCNPYADPTSETAQRYARIEAALDDLLQLSPRGPADVHYWMNRVLSGWPGYGYDNVNTLEAVVRAYRAFDVELRKYNREPAYQARLSARARGMLQ